MEFREESLVRGKGSALLRQSVGGRIEFARVVGADLSENGPSSSTGAGHEAIKNGRHNVMAFSSADVGGEDTLTAPAAQEMNRAASE